MLEGHQIDQWEVKALLAAIVNVWRDPQNQIKIGPPKCLRQRPKKTDADDKDAIRSMFRRGKK